MEQDRPTRRVTMEDVARHAKVSRALVSIVMRRVPGASEATRRRVLAAADELGYRPDLRARALAGQTSRFIGVIFGVGVGSFHFDLLEGLYVAAEEHGHSLILSPLTRGRDEARAAESLRDFHFDALVMMEPATEEPLLAGSVPIVVIGWHVEHAKVDVVRTSDEQGMELAVEHLFTLGHRNIAHVDGGAGVIAHARRMAYIQAMQKHGLGHRVDVVAGGQTPADGQRAARKLLARDGLPTAVIAYNDDLAVAMASLLHHEGVNIPADLSMVGWDDQEAATLTAVPLTTIAQDPEAMTRLAVTRMVDRIEQRRVEQREVVLEARLRVRASTAPPR